MTGLSFVNIYLFPTVLLAIIWADSRSKDAERFTAVMFRAGVLLTLAATLLTMVTRLFDAARTPFLVLQAVNTVYLFCSLIAPLFWIAYVYARLHDGRNLFRSWKVRVAFGIPFALIAAVLIVNFWTGIVFSIDVDGSYKRGPWYLVSFLPMFGGLVGCAVISLIQFTREIVAERRRDCLTLAAFAVIPIVGGVVQSLFYGWWVLWPLSAVAILFVYLGASNRQISFDAMTGLYNRRFFDEFLNRRLGRPASQGGWCLIMADLDGFKGVNDAYGHAAGDEVLRGAAEALRTAFSRKRAFLARYGGDEFAVIADCADEAEAARMTEILESESVRVPGSQGPGGRVSFSAGYALRDFAVEQDAEGIVGAADTVLYRAKNARKAISIEGAGA